MDWQFLLYSFVAMLVIIDPIANIPLFGSMLEKKKPAKKKKMVRQALVIACVVLLILAVIGKGFFQLMGVQMYSFRVAGGILLFIIALEMLFGRHTRTEHTAEEGAAARELEDIVVTPMAIPLLSGPGAITTAIVLFGQAVSLEQKILVLVAIFLAFIVSWLILEFSETILDKLGPIAMKVIVRVMGMILAGIAVQFIFFGIAEGWKAAVLAA